MFRKSLIPLALLCAVTLLAAPLTAQADGNPSASGGGWYGYFDQQTGDLVPLVKFSFNAVQLKDGTAIGHAVFHYGTGPDSRLEIDIDRITFPRSDEAILSGILTSNGIRLEFRVIDRGSGTVENNADSISDPLDPFTGNTEPYLVARGNIQVRPPAAE